jgi:quinol monooxygenase YgiN
MAYADTCCMWSTLKDENDDNKVFIDEAWEHIKAMDTEWLERNFT